MTDLKRLLIEAAQKGRLEDVKQALAAGADIETTDERVRTILSI